MGKSYERGGGGTKKMRLADRLRKEVAAKWRRIHAHPFLEEVKAGTLPLDKLRLYVKQDFPFLVEYARCLALAGARSEDLRRMKLFIRLAHEHFDVEMANQKKFAKALGVSERELLSSQPLPTTTAYTNYLFKACSLGSPAEIAAALCPCAWTYQEIAPQVSKSLMKHYRLKRREVAWWDAYASQEYLEVVNSLKATIDDGEFNSGSEGIARVRRYFVRSTDLEYSFWDMAYGR